MRRGAPPLELAAASTGGALVYAVGDIHGRYDLLASLLATIAADVADRGGGRRAVLVFCGDYIDRGPDSGRVLGTIVWLMRHGDYEVHALIGNHERAMLDAVADPARMGSWLSWGGDATLASYGVEVPIEGESDMQVLVAARDDLLDRMPVSHLRLLEGLETIVAIRDYAFVHAGIRPGVPLKRQIEDDLIWIREPFLTSTERHERMIVHGHSWDGDQPQVLPNRIGIDTGAYKTGVLTAVRLDDSAVEILQARG